MIFAFQPAVLPDTASPHVYAPQSDESNLRRMVVMASRDVPYGQPFVVQRVLLDSVHFTVVATPDNWESRSRPQSWRSVASLERGRIRVRTKGLNPLRDARRERAFSLAIEKWGGDGEFHVPVRLVRTVEKGKYFVSFVPLPRVLDARTTVEVDLRSFKPRIQE